MINFQIMDWHECEHDYVRYVEEDSQRIKSIIKKAKQRLKRANETKISEETVSFVVEDYYEVIKELLVAYLLKNGMRSRNHKCLISYFYKNNPDYGQEAMIITQMSYFRNRLVYYGEDIPMNFYKRNKEKIFNIIKTIENLLF